MKKIIIAVLIIVAIFIISDSNRDSEWNNGFCKECDEGIFVQSGSVFPYAQYKCSECGHTVLH